jgi:Avidin family
MMKQEDALAASASMTAGPAVNFGGHWKNELNSTMDLQVAGDNLTGNYTSIVSANGQKITGPIVGFVSGRTISFVVNWPNASITAWVGHMVTEAGADTIETLWQLATNTPNPADPNALWESVLAGADRFVR